MSGSRNKAINMKSKFHTIEEALEEIKKGRMIIVVDDEDRENEGDFVMAAEMVTPEAINFMATIGKGLICTPMTKARAEELDLPMMVKANDSLHQTAFTISIDSIYGGTGISAADRSLTIKEMIRADIKPEEFMRPGHIFPLIAKEGGVIQRPGHTEAAVDLARLSGLNPMGVICEIMNEDGTMSRRDELFVLAEKYNLKIITIKDLINFRKCSEPTLTETSVIDFPNKFGEFKMHMFEGKNEHHFALVKGDLLAASSPLIRIHSECLTGDVFGSMRCDCGEQLEKAMSLIEENGQGVLIYLRQEGRGIGLPNKIRAYTLQDCGLDTYEANEKLGFAKDMREYGVAAEILKSLGVTKVRLMTNNPEKIEKLKTMNILVEERISIEIPSNPKNERYLKTKKVKMGHLFVDLETDKPQ